MICFTVTGLQQKYSTQSLEDMTLILQKKKLTLPIFFNSTSRSLVLIDEFGKGTNIREGQALLASCINNLASRGKDSCITIISTHFHDVLKLIYHTNGICLKTIKHARDENGYRSLYEIIDGYNIPSVSAYEDISAIFDQLLIKNSNSRLLWLSFTM